MKKTIMIALAVSLYAAGAFAADITTSTTIGGGTFAPSTKVGISIKSAATGYAATSAHLSGKYEYGTGGGSTFTGDSAKIVKKTIPTQASTNTVGVPTAVTADTALPGTGWQ
jgi:hypothetical protein